jgi:hypothetical protein
MIWLDPIVRLRLQRGVEHLHDLGPRATAEFLAEVADQIGGMPAIIGMLAEYEQMSPAALRAVGGGSASSSAAALGAAMNRRERRARTAARRREVCSVFEYQVPRGKVALTFDVDGLPPSTALIDVEKLVDVVDAVSRRIVADKTYEQVLSLFVIAFKKAKGDSSVGYATSVLGFWLALNHPKSGHEMRKLVADEIATNNRAHLTFFVAKERPGLAIAVAPQFVDLGTFVAAMPRDAVTMFVPEPRPRRPGGTA